VGQESDQPVQEKRDTARDQADPRRQERDQYHTELGRLGQSCVANLCARGRDRRAGFAARATSGNFFLVRLRHFYPAPPMSPEGVLCEGGGAFWAARKFRA